MPARTFTDDLGIGWIVWQVGPAWAERRSGQDRRVLDVEALERDAFDRRHHGDRRGDHPDVESNGALRVKIPKHMVSGWLAFEGRAVRRRLSPIPSGWEEASDAELSCYCAKAKAARVLGGPLTE